MRRSRPALVLAAALPLTGLVTLAGASTATAGPIAPKPPRWTRLASLQSTLHGDPALTQAIGRTVTVPSVTNATVGVAVRDMTTGHLVYVRNPDTPVPPASTAKNRTTGAALALLGPSFTWHTDVLARGTLSGGVLTGPLVLKGYGDPTLLQSDLASLAQQVRAAGITQVTGGILTDDSYFDAVRRNPSWNPSDFDQYYSAPVSALTMAPDTDYDASSVIVTYGPGAPGGPAQVSTIPAAAAGYLTIRNTAKTGAWGTGDSVWIDEPVDSGTITVGGSVASGLATQKVWEVAPSPQMYVATVFKSELAKAGVTVLGGANPGKAQPGDRLVARHRSMPLSKAIVPMLKLSNNMMAEALLKTISAQAGGGGTWPDGARRIRAWMTSAGVPMKNVDVVDGSGLGRANTETAMSESATLWALRGSAAFDTALPFAGNQDRMVGGTLRNRMVGTVAVNKVHAKTGTLNGVTALSGYVTTPTGRRLSMSMISSYSGTSPRPVENSLGILLAGWTGSQSPYRTTTSTSRPVPDVSDWTKRTH